MVPPTRSAASQSFRSMRWPPRSIVIAADACPRIRWTTLGSAPDPSQMDAAVCRRSCGHGVGRPIAVVARGQPIERFQFDSLGGPPCGAGNSQSSERTRGQRQFRLRRRFPHRLALLQLTCHLAVEANELCVRDGCAVNGPHLLALGAEGRWPQAQPLVEADRLNLALPARPT